MFYDKMEEAVFLSRPNRFLAEIELVSERGSTKICHVKNTARCRELLIPGVKIWVQKSDNPTRKTKYDLISVVKNGGLVNMDSQAPNKAAAEWLPKSGIFSEHARIRQEVTFGNSRFDLYVEDGKRKAFIEVKGVTLEEDGAAKFPDAPTERGVKHVRELIACRKSGYETYLLFLIQMKGIRYFEPNDRTHPAFGEALRDAARQKVTILAYDCQVDFQSMTVDQQIPVRLY